MPLGSTQLGSMPRRGALRCVALLVAVTACGGVPDPARYPDLKLTSSELELRLDDPRREFAKPITEPVTMGRGEDDTYPQQLPTTFEAKANARLARLTRGEGPKLQVNTEVRRSDVTFYNDPFRGDFVRYDVVLGFRITTTTGALLHKGSGGSWQELPHAKASSAEMRRVFEEVALAAFDRYFASEDTLEKIEAQLARYLETHPQERRTK